MIGYKGKMLSKDKIERDTPFIDKLNLIIPALAGKDFSKVYPNKVDKLELSCPEIAIHKPRVYGTPGTRILCSSRA